MSRSAIPALAAHGIKAYHIGYNPDCTKQLDFLPPSFRWRINETGDELLMMFNGYYGTEILLPEKAKTHPALGPTHLHQIAAPGAEDVALVFQFTLDNRGVPDADAVIQLWGALQKKFPNADIKASSLDDFVEEVLAKGDTSALPLVTDEIGDSWLYGVPADPIKVATFREARRVLGSAVASGKVDTRSLDYVRYMRRLVKGPAEHNWGLEIRENWMWQLFNNTHFHQVGNPTHPHAHPLSTPSLTTT